MTDPARRIQSLEHENRALRTRVDIAEDAAQALVEWLWFNGTARDAEDAAAAYEHFHGRTVPGYEKDDL